MQLGIGEGGNRIEATKNMPATCPICGQGLIPKCGKINVHHWAHATGPDCDSWYEQETEWHRGWKRLFPKEQTEVVIGSHRADIRNSKGLVIELQNSPISLPQIMEREKFYGNMIWIINAEEFAERFFLLRRMSEHVFSFKWKNLKTSWRFASKPLYFDFGTKSVEDLLSAYETDFNHFFSQFGEIESFSHKKIIRYKGESTEENSSYYTPDPSFANLADDRLKHSIMKRQTVHSNGWGSLVSMSREAALKSFGVVVPGE